MHLRHNSQSFYMCCLRHSFLAGAYNKVPSKLLRPHIDAKADDELLIHQQRKLLVMKSFTRCILLNRCGSGATQLHASVHSVGGT